MCEKKDWEFVCYESETEDGFTRSTSRMEVEGGFLYREEINRDERFTYPFAAVALQFVPKPPTKAKVKRKRQ